MDRTVIFSIPADHKFLIKKDFILEYVDKEPSWGALSKVAFTRTYARKLEGAELIEHLMRDKGLSATQAAQEAEKGGSVMESFWMTARRCVEFAMSVLKHSVVAGHRGWDEQKGQRQAKDMFKRLWDGKWLPPGRGLQFAGTPVVEKKGAAVLNNCFRGTERFITSEGSKTFMECVGKEVDVLVNSGWASATVQSYGKQKLQKVTFAPARLTKNGSKASRSNLRHDVIVTPNHRWLLIDDTVTTELAVGDSVQARFNETVSNTQEYEDGYRHGVMFGDGTAGYVYLNKPGREFHVRLCGKKITAANYFDKVSYPPTYNGDALASMASSVNLKALPQAVSPDYMMGFLAGWVFTDGSKNETSGSIRLSSQNPEAYRWLQENAALGGYLVVGHSVESNTETNFGRRSAPLAVTILTKASDVCWKVTAIEALDEEEEVYCASVPHFGTFTLSSGIYTGNCGFSSTVTIGRDFPGPFCTIMDFLMLGVGMGSDVKGADKFVVQHPSDAQVTHTVEDTREGWVEAFRLKLKSYTGGPAVSYDYSQIRAYGTPLKTFGGTSSGHKPLETLLNSVDTILQPRIGQKIGVTAIADLVNQIGVCVVAGNIRRSAEILLGDEGDEEFTKLKDPSQLRDWQRNLKDMEDGPSKLNLLEKISMHPLYTHRWASNNSLMCKVDSHFTSLLPSIQANGEPGILFMDNIRAYSRMSDPKDNRDAKVAGCNPCSEQCLEDGELCCLGELNPNAHEDLNDFLDTIKCAYLYCKAVTMLPTNNPKTNRIIAKNRRIGLSMMGIWKMYEKLGLQTCIEWWDAGYKEVRRCDAVYSEWLGCNQSIKVTSVKPGGTVPLLLSEEGGMKPPTARYYFRTVRIEQNSPIVTSCRSAGYRVEQDKASPNTVVIYFPCHDPSSNMRTSSEITIWEQLELLAALQGYWSDNMVSNTITFKPEEANQIGPALRAFAHRIKSVSFLPLVTHGYEQAPYIPITAEEYATAVAGLGNLDLSQVTEHEVDEKYCTGDVCMIQR